jgi:Na+/melibiose symporter-like transporter
MPETPRLSGLRLFAYGFPGLPGAVVLLPLYVYLPAFYADDLGLGLQGVGVVLLIARLWDVVSDPLIGMASDRLRTPLGRRKPWLLLGAPLVIFSAFPLFAPGGEASLGELLLWTSLLYLGATMISLPHNAWGAELSNDYHERSRIAGMREALVVLGTLLAAGLPALLPGGTLETLEVIPYGLAVVLPIAVLVALLLVPEPVIRQRRRTGNALRQGWKALKGNRPFLLLIAAYLVNGVANGLPATLFLLFARHVLEANQWQEGLLLLSYFLCGILSIPLWLACSRRFGKHRSWMLAMGISCLFFLPVPLLGAGDAWLFLAICMATGFCLGADLTLPASMQADVVDLDRLRSGRGRAGLFFAVWGMATKLALALAVGFAYPALALFGFDPQSESHGSIGLLALAGLYAWLPVALKLGAIWLFSAYPIDQRQQERIRGLIERREQAGEAAA